MNEPGDARDDHDQPDLDDVHLGEVPEGLGPDLHARNLESLSRDPAFSDGVLSLADTDGAHHEIALDDVSSLEEDTGGANRTKIVLRNGAIVVATGAVIAGAIAAVRYRRKKRG